MPTDVMHAPPNKYLNPGIYVSRFSICIHMYTNVYVCVCECIGKRFLPCTCLQKFILRPCKFGIFMYVFVDIIYTDLLLDAQSLDSKTKTARKEANSVQNVAQNLHTRISGAYMYKSVIEIMRNNILSKFGRRGPK